ERSTQVRKLYIVLVVVSIFTSGLSNIALSEVATPGGELKQSDASPGFVTIQNGDAGPGKNGQSVILVAPRVNNGQLPGLHSSFLNNVITDQDCYNPDPQVKQMQPCFLQVGFTFRREAGFNLTGGQVVWTDTLNGLGGIPFNPPIPYIPGHE